MMREVVESEKRSIVALSKYYILIPLQNHAVEKAGFNIH